jgi:hypothetical protein
MTDQAVAPSAPRRFEPMKTAGTQHFIERTYRESGTFQWVRETVVNAIEAGATRIHFGIEWQAVENKGVYRRTIADNGKGMTAEELVAFFNTFGGGGKPIGGAHENFGVGSKTSLLPWNRYGMVVVSWRDGDASMIWVEKDPVSGEYGLRLEAVEDEEGNRRIDPVYYPYDDQDANGCDWASLKPDWIDQNGTIVVLLGNSVEDDTVLGDPTRPEADIKGISSYLNRRLWEVPEPLTITVDELRQNDRKHWPINREMALQTSAGGADRRINRRTIEGANYFVTYPRRSQAEGKLGDSGEVRLSDGSVVEWYLWEGQRPAVQSYAAISGYIAARYRNELYDVSTHHATYRSFGISESSVRQRLWLIVRPMESGSDGSRGVYPRTDRNALLLQGGPNPGGALPIHDWASEFVDLMPEPISRALSAARGNEGGTISDEAYRDRLAERFGARWRIQRLRVAKDGDHSVDPQQVGSKVLRKAAKRTASGTATAGGGGGRSGTPAVGSMPGPDRAAKRSVAGGIPHYRLVSGADLGNPGMIAAWAPHDPEFAEGVVLINRDHPVILEEIAFFQAQFPAQYAEDIRRDVLEAYGQIAVAKVAHSEHLRSILSASNIQQMRTDEALTMSLVGLVSEEAFIAPRLGGKYGRKRQAA